MSGLRPGLARTLRGRRDASPCRLPGERLDSRLSVGNADDADPQPLRRPADVEADLQPFAQVVEALVRPDQRHVLKQEGMLRPLALRIVPRSAPRDSLSTVPR